MKTFYPVRRKFHHVATKAPRNTKLFFIPDLRRSEQGRHEGRLDLQTFHGPEGIRQGCQRTQQDSKTDHEE